MAKRTAIIDIGSNSLSLVIYEKSSRFAFHLIEKVRASVRIGEGAHEKGGELQEEAMDKAFCALKDFLFVAENVKCKKILCVATSALRDAPNKKVFLQRVQKELKLGIKVIDGKEEAYFGAIAAMNLLEPMATFTTIDIGGGSTELAKIEGGKITQSLTLNIGTVRLKELFVDTKNPEKIDSFIQESIASVAESFKSQTIVGIGGTIRALSSAIMKQEKYPINSLHGFRYQLDDYAKMLKEVPHMDKASLSRYDFPNSRLDTIQEGTEIFCRLLSFLDAKEIIASKAGVREGVYLHDILRNSNYIFPRNFNISIKSLIDRFALNAKNCSYVQRLSWELFDTLFPLHQIEHSKRELLGFSAKLSPLSKRINIYSNSDNSFYFFLENLNFTFSHDKKLLIALLLKLSSKKRHREEAYKKYESLLPEVEMMEWLYFMLKISECINSNRKIQKVVFALEERTLTIFMQEGLHLCEACLKKVNMPNSLTVILKSSS